MKTKLFFLIVFLMIVSLGTLRSQPYNVQAYSATTLYSVPMFTATGTTPQIGNSVFFQNSAGTNVGVTNLLKIESASSPYGNFLGYLAGNVNTGTSNVGIGYNALMTNYTGQKNTATGTHSLKYNSTGSNNTANGYGTLNANLASNNTAVGFSAMSLNNSGGNNTANGYYALYTNYSGSNNTALGFQSGYSNYSGAGNVFLGYNAGYSETGSNKLYIANSSGTPLIYGDFSTIKVGIGTTTPSCALEVNGQIKITGGIPGNGKVLTSDASGFASWSTPITSSTAWQLTGNTSTVDGTDFIGTTDNVALNFRVYNEKAGRIDNAGSTFLGYQAGKINTVTNNTGFGYKALFSNTTGNCNTANGYQALYTNSNGDRNTATGKGSLYSNTIGCHNTAIGVHALYSNTIGGSNTAIGSDALFSNTAAGSQNCALGELALSDNTTGCGNIAIGTNTLSNNITGHYNTALGYNAEVSSNNLIYATAIGAGAIVGASNSLILGGTGGYAVNVGIGTTTPNSKLEIGLGGDIALVADPSGNVNDPGDIIFKTASGTQKARIWNSTSNNALYFCTNSTNTASFSISNSGIWSNEVQVATSSPWGDFVFDKDYKIMPLEELHEFVKTNRHLPGIPSAKTIEEKGINVYEIINSLTQKTEELTLYIIELQKQIDKLKVGKE